MTAARNLAKAASTIDSTGVIAVANGGTGVDTAAEIATLVGNLLYPVGSIYTNTTNATNPGTLLGFGTWVAFGAGRVMIGLDAGNALFDTAEETGGSADAIAVSHTHSFSATSGGQSQTHSHSISVSDPGHLHQFNSNPSADGNARGLAPGSGYTVAGIGGIVNGGAGAYYTTDTAGNQIIASATTGITSSAGNASADHTHSVSGTTGSTGSSGTNANYQPYITVRMWKRTA